MSTVEKTQATIEDLYLVEGKAELVHGKIETMSPSGFRHLRMNDTIVESLRLYERSTRSGFACGDGGGFLCDLPHRKSFSPDSSYYTGEIPQNPDDFLPEPPTFAVEIRSKMTRGQSRSSEWRKNVRIISRPVRKPSGMSIQMDLW